MSDSLMRYICIATLLYAALLRLKELRISKINQIELESKGYTRKDNFLSYLNMVSLHTSFFIMTILELIYLPLLQNLAVQVTALLVFGVAQVVRFSALSALGTFWNTNIMSADRNSTFVQKGPYRFIRHPNYLAVILEFVSIPMIGGAWRSALLYSIWNGLVLEKRIIDEESELFKIPGYLEAMGKKRRFVPRII